MDQRSGAPKKTHVPEEIEFRTKPQIALGLIDRALANDVRVAAWTVDELYGRDGKFLDGLQERGQTFVAEVPVDFHGWVQKPSVLRNRPKKQGKRRGQPKRYPRLARRRPSCEVRNLAKYSPLFRDQSWQRYRIQDTDKGPQVWEIKWAVFWRKNAAGLPGRRHCLIVARNVLTGEMKYFVANRIPGESGVTLRWLLRVAFGRWLFLTQLSQWFCARVRQKYDEQADPQADRLTVEQVRSAMNTWLSSADLKPAARTTRYEREHNKQRYHQRRNKQARTSHTQTRIDRLGDLGIDVDHIKSCIP
ncbi:MAG: transposase [Planctomycetes bacterium]|nr:transposase [Planctomycetota bacterium]